MKAENRPKYLVIAVLMTFAILPMLIILWIDATRGNESTEGLAWLWFYFVAPALTILSIVMGIIFWVHDSRAESK